MNFKQIIIFLVVQIIILFFTYFFIIKRFNSFIKDHQEKIDDYMFKTQGIYKKENKDNEIVKDENSN